MCGSIKEVEYKQNNLRRAKEAAAAAEQEEAEEVSEKETAEPVRKICFIFEPKGCFKERQDYALYIFPPDNLYVLPLLLLSSRADEYSPYKKWRYAFIPITTLGQMTHIAGLCLPHLFSCSSYNSEGGHQNMQ